MSDVNALLVNFFAVCNEADPARRKELIGETFQADATFVDPLFQARGEAELDTLLAQILTMFPGHVTRQKGEADAHHNVVRFSWEIVPDGGDIAIAGGTDFGVIASDGRFKSITSFFDLVPAGIM